MKIPLFSVLLFFLSSPGLGLSQSFTSYFTGNEKDLVTQAQGGVCMMGGSVEQDDAMRWFLQRANGGDVTILRASGADGYNDYFYSELGVDLNSVETIVFASAAASNEEHILSRIAQSEAIWIAGGDQWNYVSYWRNTPVQLALNTAISQRNIVIGGTSAGMAILGGFYFSAQNGSVTSETALNNPFATNVTVDNTPFLSIPYLNNVITDTHYDNPVRKGRHITFLARGFIDSGTSVNGIACEERMAVCIDETGIARVFANSNITRKVYFLQPSCEITNPIPEICQQGLPLTWNHDEKAVRVYEVQGDENGSNSFNVDTWLEGTGGVWRYWSAQNGVLQENVGEAPDCIPLKNQSIQPTFYLFPNPATSHFFIKGLHSGKEYSLDVFNSTGKKVIFNQKMNNHTSIELPLPAGIYHVCLYEEEIVIYRSKVIIQPF